MDEGAWLVSIPSGTVATFRIYLNDFDSPLPWSLDDGDPANEMNFVAITANVPLITRLAEPGADPKLARAWVEVKGRLRIEDGYAVVER